MLFFWDVFCILKTFSDLFPLFIGELSATFDAETDTTTIDWEEGVQDDDLTINIYRSSMAPETIDPNALVAEVDAAQSSY